MTKFFLLICTALLPFVYSSQTVSYDIYALKFGERKNKISIEEVAVGETSGDSTKVFFMYWLLKGSNGKNILVDAGFTEDAKVDTQKITFTAPEKLLAVVNVKPEEITDIIITHPHWDHIGGIDLYPSAMVWMQQKDYDDLISKKKNPEASGYNKADIQKVLKRKENGTLKLLQAKRDEVIMPNVTVVTASVHTPGSQYVTAYNGKQNVFIASDNCKYYHNIIRMKSIPGPHDQKAYVRTLRNMKAMMPDIDLIIPGHDPLVFEKFKSVGKDVVEIKK
ncbi:MAG: N-acyl homoserine lactonase family protein [Bacteroidetes bacterium]|jgi:glyoxylase-like metal-dependent hydrolase (beta-lactamase superfamily II)|nr:N-acyl homoserine lactonase family protein [Bacteroidota bacterium]